jgi:predicted nucleotidyltransferase
MAQNLANSQIEKIKWTILPILRNYGVTKAGIFGSAARGKMTKKSDIDILVEIGEDLSLLDMIGLKIELEEALGRKVDLVEYQTIKPLLKERILKDHLAIL